MLFEGGLAGPVLAALYASIGAAQLGTVLATPIPAYAKGGDIKKDHVGLINDGGNQEFIERNGKLLTTDKANVAVPLQSGDRIYPSFQEMERRSLLINSLMAGEAATQTQIQ